MPGGGDSTAALLHALMAKVSAMESRQSVPDEDAARAAMMKDVILAAVREALPVPQRASRTRASGCSYASQVDKTVFTTAKVRRRPCFSNHV